VDILLGLPPHRACPPVGVRPTGHSPNWERPEQVARDIEAFLR
jgi:pimeloyl-ACP methyl ester carboxylesterase